MTKLKRIKQSQLAKALNNMVQELEKNGVLSDMRICQTTMKIMSRELKVPDKVGKVNNQDCFKMFEAYLQEVVENDNTTEKRDSTAKVGS